jgi:arylsulfatase A-like enzyme
LPDNCLLWLHSRGIPEPWYPPAEYQDLYFPEFGLADDEEEVAESDENEEDDLEEGDLEEDSADGFGEGLEGDDETPALTEYAERGTALGAEEVVEAGDRVENDLEPDDELQRRLGRALYAACATAVDRLVGRVVTALRETGVLDECLLVISAARGQALGEHTPIGIDPELPHAELTHVPLLVRGPNPDWEGVRHRALVQPADVRGLVLDWLSPGGVGGDSPSWMTRMLGTAQLSANSSPTTVDESPRVAIAGWRDRGWMVRDRNAVYLCPWAIPEHGDDPEGRLYALPADRHEFADILGQAADEAARLWNELKSRVGERG